MIPERYFEKVYAGFVGKNIGVRLGAPVESLIWTYDRIREMFGEHIHGYLRPYKDFGADDDVNGPVYFFRTLAESDDPTLQDFARAWVDCVREEKGFFWWGGVGISNSQTVYGLLKRGATVPIPREVLAGPKKMSESIGGQIFIDFIGLALPGQPERAAELGERFASVAHFCEGVYGGRFMAAAVASAFTAKGIFEVIETALRQIPEDSDYARVVRSVLDFHALHPDDWRACYQMLADHWGYDRYSGICPMIPNAGVCILALAYGDGSFDRSVEIATMCGWDTDCNAGNVGTIMGVFCGIEAISDCYIEPFHDTAILSGVSGTLNNCDMPSFAREVALRGYQLAGETPPEALVRNPKDLIYDFELPKSTHGFRVSDPFILQIAGSEKRAYRGGRSLQVCFNRLQKGNSARIFFKPFYTRADFNDGRYSPVFSQKVCPGQTLSMRLYMEQWTGEKPIQIAPYVRTAFSQRIVAGESVAPTADAWSEIRYQIPDVEGEIIDEVGLIVTSFSTNTADFESRDLGRFFIDCVEVTGNARYAIAFEKAMTELGNLTPFSHNRGEWVREESAFRVKAIESTASFTGNYHAADYSVLCNVTCEKDSSACLLVRGLGTVRHVLCGLLPDGKAGILLGVVGGYQTLASVPFAWEPTRSYCLTAICKGDTVTLLIDGVQVAAASDIPYAHGMFGMGLSDAGSATFAGMVVEELDA